VLSDLHLPNPRTNVVARTVAALVKLQPRFVAITGDWTNGSAGKGVGREWWKAVAEALAPLRAAHIPILPVAGNHDSYTPAQQHAYAAAFADLVSEARPLTIASEGHGFAGAPYSYSVDLDGVHLSFAHVVEQAVRPEVADWLAKDLAAAQRADQRIVFAHVPMSSVIQPPNARFAKQFGALLEGGHADLLVVGHEHVVWDDDVALPGGGTIHQVLVGCSSGFYSYEPSDASKARAQCAPIDAVTALAPAATRPVVARLVKLAKLAPKRCTMPHGGGAFTLSPGRKHRMIQHHAASFALVTVDGASSSVQPMTLDASGAPVGFYLP
jgi:predicted phosphodiesterase